MKRQGDKSKRQAPFRMNLREMQRLKKQKALQEQGREEERDRDIQNHYDSNSKPSNQNSRSEKKEFQNKYSQESAEDLGNGQQESGVKTTFKERYPQVMKMVEAHEPKKKEDKTMPIQVFLDTYLEKNPLMKRKKKESKLTSLEIQEIEISKQLYEKDPIEYWHKYKQKSDVGSLMRQFQYIGFSTPSMERLNLTEEDFVNEPYLEKLWKNRMAARENKRLQKQLFVGERGRKLLTDQLSNPEGEENREVIQKQLKQQQSNFQKYQDNTYKAVSDYYSVNDNEDEVKEREEFFSDIELRHFLNRRRVQYDLDWNRPRVVIETIVIDYFKSFGMECKAFEISSAFNLITGKNGNGKSNVLDALLFVFGFGSKHLRHSKLEHLINTYKEDMDDFEGCSVTIKVHYCRKENPEDKFVNTEGRAPITVKRIIEYSGKSSYEIDGKEATYSQLSKLCEEWGIDLVYHRFLVQQGKVAKISDLKSKGTVAEPGLIEVFEEVIGTNTYAQRIESTRQEIETGERELIGLREELSVKAEVAKRSREEMRQALRFYESLNKYFKLIDLNTQSEIHSLTRNCSNLASIIISTLSLHNKDYFKPRSSHNQQQPDNQLLSHQADKRPPLYTLTQTQLNTKLSRTLSIIDKYSSQIDHILSEDSTATTKLKQLQERVQTQIQSFFRLTKQDPIDQAICVFKNISQQPVSKEIQALEKKVEYIHQKLKKQNVLEHFPSDFELRLENMKRLEMEITGMDNERKEIQQREGEIEREINKLKEERMKQEEQLKGLITNSGREQELVNVMQNKMRSDKQGIQEMQNQYYELKKREDILGKSIKVRVDKIRDQQNQKGSLVDRVMEAGIPGVYGRLGNLGKCTDEKISQIISSIYGGGLNNIVVESSEAGHQVLNFLTQQNIGRATCIVLERIKRFEEEINKRLDENIGKHSVRLFDKIKPIDPKFRTAFYFLIRDAEFVPNSELFIEVAEANQKRRATITMGEMKDYIIKEKSGVMSRREVRHDGFGKAASTNVGLLKKEIDEFQKQLKEVQGLLASLEKKKQRMNQGIDETSKELEFVTKAKAATNTEIGRIRNTIESIKMKIKKEEKQRESESDKVKRINQIYPNKVSQLSLILQRDKRQKLAIITKVGYPNLYLWKMMNNYKSQLRKLREIMEESIRSQAKEKEYKARVIKQNKNIVVEIARLVKPLQKLRMERVSRRNRMVELLEKRHLEIEKMKYCLVEVAMKWNHNQLQAVYEEFKRPIQGHMIEAKSRKEESEVYCLLRYLKEEASLYQSNIKFSQQLGRLTDKSKVRYEYLSAVKQSSFVSPEARSDFVINSLKPVAQNLSQIRKPLNFYPFTVGARISEEEHAIIDTVREELLSECQSYCWQVKQELKREEAAESFRFKFVEYQNQAQIVNSRMQRLEGLLRSIEILRYIRIVKFNKGYISILIHFRRVFNRLSEGGDAMIISKNKDDPFKSGLVILIKPLNKGWRDLITLSGGEKSLTTISLTFAFQQFKPSPFYLMDEIDAALDTTKTRLVSSYLSQQSAFSQIIMISLRAESYRYADDFIHVAKTEDGFSRFFLKPLGVDNNVGREVTEKRATTRVYLNYQNCHLQLQSEFINIEDLWDPDVIKVWKHEIKQDQKQRLYVSETLLQNQIRKRFLWMSVLEFKMADAGKWIIPNNWSWEQHKKVFFQQFYRGYFYLKRTDYPHIKDSKPTRVVMDEEELSLDRTGITDVSEKYRKIRFQLEHVQNVLNKNKKEKEIQEEERRRKLEEEKDEQEKDRRNGLNSRRENISGRNEEEKKKKGEFQHHGIIKELMEHYQARNQDEKRKRQEREKEFKHNPDYQKKLKREQEMRQEQEMRLRSQKMKQKKVEDRERMLREQHQKELEEKYRELMQECPEDSERIYNEVTEFEKRLKLKYEGLRQNQSEVSGESGREEQPRSNPFRRKKN